MNITTFSNMASKIPSPGQLEGLVTFMKDARDALFLATGRRQVGGR